MLRLLSPLTRVSFLPPSRREDDGRQGDRVCRAAPERLPGHIVSGGTGPFGAITHKRRQHIACHEYVAFAGAISTSDGLSQLPGVSAAASPPGHAPTSLGVRCIERSVIKRAAADVRHRRLVVPERCVGAQRRRGERQHIVARRRLLDALHKVADDRRRLERVSPSRCRRRGLSRLPIASYTTPQRRV